MESDEEKWIGGEERKTSDELGSSLCRERNALKVACQLCMEWGNFWFMVP